MQRGQSIGAHDSSLVPPTRAGGSEGNRETLQRRRRKGQQTVQEGKKGTDLFRFPERRVEKGPEFPVCRGLFEGLAHFGGPFRLPAQLDQGPAAKSPGERRLGVFLHRPLKISAGERLEGARE